MRTQRSLHRVHALLYNLEASVALVGLAREHADDVCLLGEERHVGDWVLFAGVLDACLAVFHPHGRRGGLLP